MPLCQLCRENLAWAPLIYCKSCMRDEMGYDYRDEIDEPEKETNEENSC